MPEELKERFIAKLEEQYGPWEKMTSRFGNATFGKVAKDLCISASQFSKLLSGNATEGMYIRSIRNVQRLVDAQQAATERDRALEQVAQLKHQNKSIRLRIIMISLLTLLLGATAVYVYYKTNLPQQIVQFNLGQHPLSLYFDQGFDADFDSPYLKESEVQDYCPCSAYEGTWSLADEYKLPLPGNRKPGVYYLAKSADVRMKCSKS
ncbi:MAG: hypothetical protein KDD06_10040, partial [Phaeodactylibacter sp.]|nr:hypothetical protein [Phaeodactylibacter sp.]